MLLFDTHCHLDFPTFDADREAILAACEQAGVARILLPGVEAAHWNRLQACCEGRDGLYPALGVHPGFVAGHDRSDLERLDALLSDGKALAVGEIGLDFWVGRETEKEQIWWLEAQLDLARAHRLPVLLHVRKAHDQVLKRLRHWQVPRGGVVHAFSGSTQQAEQYLALGFRLGVGGGVTYPRAKRLRGQVAQLPLEAWVLETDAPDMPLCGCQGQRNRPDLLPRVLASFASLREESEALVAKILWKNSLELLSGAEGAVQQPKRSPGSQ
ncbi:TatD family hydrolase [Motiliproteus sp. SC1-56]|uniref:TatD family hydrolase n=1 Tax=Motiliproteus sp. SC1-56 TaxID=2799565 RepID=UPI001A8FA900|nr:TatD family hydrolase [Motiliproteus sp. SC1-56]